MDSGPAPRGVSRNDDGEWSRRGLVADRQHAAPDLILLDRFEQRLEIALAETVVALALDELEEDRPDGVGRKDLQQHLGLAAFDHAFAVDQDAVAPQARNVLAVLRQPG